MTGQITILDRDKRFGFLQDESGAERFFGAKNCTTPFDTLRLGADVTFEPYDLKNARDRQGKEVSGKRADRVTVRS